MANKTSKNASKKNAKVVVAANVTTRLAAKGESFSGVALATLREMLGKAKGKPVMRGALKDALLRRFPGVDRASINNVLTGLTTRLVGDAKGRGAAAGYRGFVLRVHDGAEAGFRLGKWPSTWAAETRARIGA